MAAACVVLRGGAGCCCSAADDEYDDELDYDDDEDYDEEHGDGDAEPPQSVLIELGGRVIATVPCRTARPDVTYAHLKTDR